MMKVFSVNTDSRYDGYGIPSNIPDDVYYEMSMANRGSPIDSDVLHLKLEVVLVSQGALGKSDFVCGDKWVLVRKPVMELLDNMLGSLGQWIEVVGQNENYFFFRVNNVIDVLDPELSDYQQVTPTYKRLIKPVFNIENTGENTLIFYQNKINSRLFVNQEFKDFIELHGLTGLSFEEC